MSKRKQKLDQEQDFETKGELKSQRWQEERG
jgi:hypothetical protein